MDGRTATHEGLTLFLITAGAAGVTAVDAVLFFILLFAIGI